MSIRSGYQIPVANSYRSQQNQAQSYGQRSNSEDGNSKPSITELLRQLTTKVEDIMDSVSGPIKPLLPPIGRFLIVSTFYEDAWRIITQWTDQKRYLVNYRHIPTFFVVVFLLINIIIMPIGSSLIIGRKHSEWATASLMFILALQAVTYGLLFDFKFFMRNLSVAGGLLMVVSDSFVVLGKRSLPGLPSLGNDDDIGKQYVQLVGRILLVAMFGGLILSSKWSYAHLFVSLFGSAFCISVLIGFKAKISALALVFILSIYNIIAHPYWTFNYGMPKRDFFKYEFFQTLSVIGGLLLVVNTGPGAISIDEKKKVY